MKTATRQLCTGLWLGSFAGLCAAGVSSGFMSVSISLTNPAATTLPASAPTAASTATSLAAGVCVSQTLSEQTSALVQVSCATGQFVSITPIPGKPFLGTHGGAFRYNMEGPKPSGMLISGGGGFNPGTGTVTALRIYNANGTDGPLEMLVSF